MARRRHLARIIVMQVLFEREQHAETDVTNALQHNVREFPEVDAHFAESLLTGVFAKEREIKEVIEAHAPGWPLERMDPISRALLFIGAYELLFAGDVPPAVVMDEAIEIAKEYGTEESGKFVNGVLNAIAHRNGDGGGEGGVLV